jgi:sugar (pentulose or hexulose) kinase
MSGDVLIGIDAGTSVIKSVAFSTAGEEVAIHAIPGSAGAAAASTPSGRSSCHESAAGRLSLP